MNRDGATHAIDLAAIARDAGLSAWVHASRLGGPPGVVELSGREPVAIASVYKLPLALAWAVLVEDGQLDPHERVRVRAEGRVAGPTGIAMLFDDVEMSQRDVVRLMLAVSDNAAGDAILSLIGLERVHRLLQDLGMPTSLVRHGSAAETASIMRDTDADSWVAAQAALADPDRMVETSQYDPAYASSGSAADLTAALRILWRRPGDPYALVRDAMTHQAWRHRIGSGFPHDDVTVHGKTGSLGSLRHEVAVVRFPDEHPVAVTVLTRSVRPERHQPRVDAAIGALARRAVAPLRLPVT